MTIAANISRVCKDLEGFLLEKNKAYGNSVGDPLNVFSTGTPKEQMGVRIDDKLSRLKRGHEYPGDDTIKDLAGYLILWLALEESTEEAPREAPSEPCPIKLTDGMQLRRRSDNAVGTIRDYGSGIIQWKVPSEGPNDVPQWLHITPQNRDQFIPHQPFG